MSDLPDDILVLTLSDAPASRLDKALADAAPEGAGLSRSRISKLIAKGDVTDRAGDVAKAKDSALPGAEYLIRVPAPEDLENAAPENLPIDIVFEDEHLIVVNKPVGMVVHPAPGSPNGTLVNALLFHCTDILGVGASGRPGIVHRIDKDTSGLLVVAKTDAAHQGLAAQFADHSIDRRYLAFCVGVPSKADPRLAGLKGVGFEDGGIIRVATNVARHKTDRKRMAVVQDRGKHAITRIEVLEKYNRAAMVSCRLETGRTHQIRVHMSHIGHRLIGDPVYGKNRSLAGSDRSAEATEFLAGFRRQALHAQSLGFAHPISKKRMDFQMEIPEDLTRLRHILREHA